MRPVCTLLCLVSLTVACGGGDDFTTGDGTERIDGSVRPDAPLPDAALTPPDAAILGPDATPAAIRGQLCILSDIRSPETCDPLHLANIVVTIDGVAGATDVTNAQGVFELAPQPGFVLATLVARDPGGMYHLAGQLAPLDDGGNALDVKIPMVTKARFAEILAANAIVENDTRGHLVVKVKKAGTTSAQTAATLGPIGDTVPRYELGSPNEFTTAGNAGSTGFAVYLNAPPGADRIDITVGSTLRKADYVVVEDSLTFATVTYAP
jgi:hypothetical protein